MKTEWAADRGRLLYPAQVTKLAADSLPHIVQQTIMNEGSPKKALESPLSQPICYLLMSWIVEAFRNTGFFYLNRVASHPSQL